MFLRLYVYASALVLRTSVDARSEIHELYISFIYLVILSRRESPTKREWNNEAGETSEDQ